MKRPPERTIRGAARDERTGQGALDEAPLMNFIIMIIGNDEDMLVFGVIPEVTTLRVNISPDAAARRGVSQG
jgi:hypothetical protein